MVFSYYFVQIRFSRPPHGSRDISAVSDVELRCKRAAAAEAGNGDGGEVDVEAGQGADLGRGNDGQVQGHNGKNSRFCGAHFHLLIFNLLCRQLSAV